jgi:hypothetical protein
METLKNIVKSIICSALIASLSIPIVYAFDGLIGGGLAQISQDLKHLVPEKDKTNTAVTEVNNQTSKNNGSTNAPKQAIRQDISDKKTDAHKNRFFLQILNFYR